MTNGIETYEEYLRFRKSLDPLLLNLLGSESLVDRWWNTPNKAFDRQSPDEMMSISWRGVTNYILQFK